MIAALAEDVRRHLLATRSRRPHPPDAVSPSTSGPSLDFTDFVADGMPVRNPGPRPSINPAAIRIRARGTNAQHLQPGPGPPGGGRDVRPDRTHDPHVDLCRDPGQPAPGDRDVPPDLDPQHAPGLRRRLGVVGRGQAPTPGGAEAAGDRAEAADGRAGHDRRRDCPGPRPVPRGPRRPDRRRAWRGGGASRPCASEVVVEREGEWQPALVLRRSGDRCLIHTCAGYGYADMSENEWVDAGRVRFPASSDGTGADPWGSQAKEPMPAEV